MHLLFLRWRRSRKRDGRKQAVLYAVSCEAASEGGVCCLEGS